MAARSSTSRGSPRSGAEPIRGRQAPPRACGPAWSAAARPPTAAQKPSWAMRVPRRGSRPGTRCGGENETETKDRLGSPAATRRDLRRGLARSARGRPGCGRRSRRAPTRTTRAGAPRGTSRSSSGASDGGSREARGVRARCEVYARPRAPGNRSECRPKRSPARCSALRTLFSGCVFLPFTLAMIRLRVSGSNTSTTALFPFPDRLFVLRTCH